ncbi:alpha-defensin 15-like [Dipodomys spectabilis]|uniref:alpha-defensin 15-like n=1 Tax=Dipodomys spectabilis TaxID=105255 RepID=UPI001C53BF3F|nr:alpha-defensin 15-like [Dipodomys spectabilis]
MRTLALLAALLLLTLQAQAQTLPENVEEDALQEQPGEGDTISVSFTGTEGSALQKAGLKKVFNCRCRQRVCGARGQVFGICRQGNRNYVFCCR